jgi:hypothetical protein
MHKIFLPSCVTFLLFVQRLRKMLNHTPHHAAMVAVVDADKSKFNSPRPSVPKPA